MFNDYNQLCQEKTELFITLCRIIKTARLEQDIGIVWRSKNVAEGAELQDHFIMGIAVEQGKQISCLLTIDRWEDCYFAKQLEYPPEHDGHDSEIILERLKKI